MAPTPRARRGSAQRGNRQRQPQQQHQPAVNQQASFELADGAAAGTPCWGKLLGSGIKVAHLFADKTSYESSEVLTPTTSAPLRLKQLVANVNFRISWNGYGIPGRGAESKRTGEWSLTHMHFTVQNQSSHPILVGAVHVLQGHASPVSWGQTIQLASDQALQGASLPSELAQVVFVAPNLPALGPAPTDAFHSDYRLGPPLASGQFGTVHRAVKIVGGEEYAVKVIKRKLTLMRDSEFAGVERECDIMREISAYEAHENIVRYYSTYRTADRLYIVMEYVRGQDLLEGIRKAGGLSENDTRYLMRQLITGMAYLHSREIAHRDLKPENLLLTVDDPPVLKIGDFGMAKISHSRTTLQTRCGTRMYAAPEVFRGVSSYDKSVDVWSIGVIMFTMLTCQYPFVVDVESQQHWMPAVKDMQLHLLDGKLSPLGRDFFFRMVKDDPRERITLQDALNHEWFREPTGRIGRLPSSKTASYRSQGPPTPRSQDSSDWATVRLNAQEPSYATMATSSFALVGPSSSTSQPLAGTSSDYFAPAVPGAFNQASTLLSPLPSQVSQPLQNQAGPSTPTHIPLLGQPSSAPPTITQPARTPTRFSPRLQAKRNRSLKSSSLRKTQSSSNMRESAKRKIQAAARPRPAPAEGSSSRPQTRSVTAKQQRVPKHFV